MPPTVAAHMLNLLAFFMKNRNDMIAMSRLAFGDYDVLYSRRLSILKIKIKMRIAPHVTVNYFDSGGNLALDLSNRNACGRVGNDFK
jgi:hypothetical protein